MLLAVDIGNTNITLGLFEGRGADEPFAPEPLRRWALSSTVARTHDEMRLVLRSLLAEEKDAARAIDAAVLGSVVPSLNIMVRDALRTLLDGVDLLELDATTPLPVRNGYRVPAEVGADRLANAVGGVARLGAPLIVIDLGTATTFDIVDAEPCYRGGLIMPGPALAAEALNLRTARLPRVAAARPARIVGETTTEALQAGLYWGMIGSIDFLVDKIEAELGWRDTTVVATGGLANSVVEDSRRIARYEPDLTLFGLAEIWRFQRR